MKTKKSCENEPLSLRWYHVTPDRFIIGAFTIEIILLLASRMRWFPTEWQKGWPVLGAVVVAIITVVVLLLWKGHSVVFRRQFRICLPAAALLAASVVIAVTWFLSAVHQARIQRRALEAIHNDPYSTYTQSPQEVPWYYLPRAHLGDDFFVTVDEVRFAGPEVTDALVAYIDCLPQTRIVEFDQTKIADTTLLHLGGLSNLQDLYITRSPVSDKGLQHLRSLKSLRKLRIYGTKVTDSGVESLKQALPNCTIEYGSHWERLLGAEKAPVKTGGE